MGLLKRLWPPAGPQGETFLSCARNRGKSTTPSVAALGAPGAHRRTLGVADFPRCRLLRLQHLPYR
eukprot:2337386-Alexandrium_andersonii.AAC.1